VTPSPHPGEPRAPLSKTRPVGYHAWRTTGLGRCTIAEFLGQSAVIIDPQPSVVTRSSPCEPLLRRLNGFVHRLATLCHWQGRGSAGALITEDITIAVATSFDASGWITARHLLRPRWVIGRTQTATPTDITETDLGAGLASTLGVLGASRVRRGPHQGAPACAGVETYPRDLRGSAGVESWVRSSLGHACACCFRTRGNTGPVVSVPLTQSLSKALGVGSRAALAPSGRLC
jgi:hypothetical protein